MFVLSAYAPPSYSHPCLVYEVCQCKDTGRGAHIIGCFIDALSNDGAIRRSHEFDGTPKWFEVARFETWTAALRQFRRYARVMQSDGASPKKWQSGWDTYRRLYDQFKDAPRYERPKVP